MTIKLRDTNGRIRQLNLNDTAGELWSSRNLDLHSNVGKIKLARPFKQVATATQLSNDTVVAFASIRDNSQINTAYALTANNLYVADSTFTSWTVAQASPARAEDATIFGGQLIISSQTNLDAWDFNATYTTGWWTARGNPALTTNNPTATVPRVIETSRIGAETLVVLDGSNIYAYVGGITSGAVTNLTLDLDSSLKATCFKTGIRSGWIGTYTNTGDEAFVIQWDVASTNYTQAFPTGSKSVLALEVVDDIPYIITDRGEIKRFNNAGFTTVAQFPFATRAVFADQNTNPSNVNRPIHPKGIWHSGNTLFIYANFLSATSAFPLDERTHNGLWALDLTTNSLTHLGSQANDVVFGSTGSTPIMVLDDYRSRIFLGLNDVNSNEGIYIEDLSASSENYGYLVTTEIQSEELKDVWEKIVSKAYLATNDKIEVKYRGSKVEGYPVNISGVTWTGLNENTFTTTSASMAAVKTRFDAGNEDEIEILTGQSAGRLAHITNITYSNPTYTVTIDEEIGVNGQTSTIRIDNWKKVPKSMTSADGQMLSFGTDQASDWIQYKISLFGQAGNPEIREIAIKSNTKEKL